MLLRDCSIILREKCGFGISLSGVRLLQQTVSPRHRDDLYSFLNLPAYPRSLPLIYKMVIQWLLQHANNKIK